jgi:hypothetical protein
MKPFLLFAGRGQPSMSGGFHIGPYRATCCAFQGYKNFQYSRAYSMLKEKKEIIWNALGHTFP